ncbi:RNA recognition motif domain-containing protein [Thalassotalea profundi]|uniref:RNA-binding protein n=1 Tax=Thalassotalea profundi TaxID=2036687 RepID=A0ABQ3IQY6_9GAMM|nr:RNA-binding protein [Thalassotalea profundi]GHE89957.1 RNA-binding protein [Thalassotalea profundi]
MNSSLLLTFGVAFVLAVVSYITATQVELTPILVSVIAFISAIIFPLFFNKANNSSASTEVKTLYVGNLPYRANEGSVRALFSEYGQVHSVRLMKDKQTGKRRGFGFVEISANDAKNTIAKLNDSEFQQRTLKVREAKERPEKSDNDE